MAVVSCRVQQYRLVVTILEAAAVLSCWSAALAAGASPARGLQQTEADPASLTTALIASANEALTTSTETKKSFSSDTLTKDANHSTALKSLLKKNHFVGSTILKSKGANQTSKNIEVTQLDSIVSPVASSSAPIPSLINPSMKIQKSKIKSSQDPEATVKKSFVSVRESNKTAGGPHSDMQTASSVLATISARQLFDPKSSYYYRPIYDYTDHSSAGLLHDKRHDFDKDRSRPSSSSDGRYKFTNAHSRPSQTYGHQQTYDDGYAKEEGQQGADGYSRTAGHLDDSYGQLEDVVVGGGHTAEGETLSSHADDVGYAGHSAGGSQGEAGHDKGEKGYVSKGHIDEGFDNVHRKVEYGYLETFGDDGSFETYGSEHDSGDAFYDQGAGGNYEQLAVEDEELYDAHGATGSGLRSDFDEKFKSIKASLAEELNFGDHDSYGDHDSHDEYGASHGSRLGFGQHYGIGDTHDISSSDRHGPYSSGPGASHFPHGAAFDSIERSFSAGWQGRPRPASGADVRGGGGLYGLRDPLFRKDIV